MYPESGYCFCKTRKTLLVNIVLLCCDVKRNKFSTVDILFFFPMECRAAVLVRYVDNLYIHLRRSRDGTVFVRIRVVVILASFSSLWVAVALCT